MEVASDAPEVCVRIWAEGSFDPAELDALLGVSGKTKRKGDLRRGGTVEADDSWYFSTELEPTVHWDEHLDRVLALVRPHRGEFVAFRARHELAVGVQLVAYICSAQFSGEVSREYAAELALLGCSFGLDLYCVSD